MARAMSVRQRRFWWVAAIVLGVGGGVGLTYLVATGTSAGRNWLLSTLVTRANGVFGGRGSLRIGVLREISPSHVVAEDVALVDTAGIPVVTARRVVGRLDVRGLFSRAIHIRRLALQGLRLDLQQEQPGRPWNIAHIISGDTAVRAPRTTPAFGDDIRIDSITVDDGEIVTRAPWSPHPVFTGRARDSVIVVRDSLHDLTRRADGVYIERRQITLSRVRAHDLVIVDVKKRPASLVLDSLAGVMSDPPVAVRQAAGRLYWTGDSLRLDLREVRLPHSRGTAVGTVAWNQPGPVRYDVLVRADAGLADLQWIWDVLPTQGRGTATVRLRTLADAYDTEYLLQDLDVQSAGSRIRGGIGITVRPADLLLHTVDLTFTPLQSDLLRRLSYDAVPPEVQGVLTGRLVAREGGPLTALRLDRLDARFVDGTIPGNDAISSVQLRGMVSLGARPRAWDLLARDTRVDLRSVRALVPDAPAVDGVITGEVLVRSADLTAADVTDIGLTWTDAAGHVSTIRGDARARYDRDTPEIHAALILDPLSMRALARVDTTLPLRSRLAGTVQLDGTLDNLLWRGDLRALSESAALPARERPAAPVVDVAVAAGAPPADTAGSASRASLSLTGTASLGERVWRGSAEGTLRNFDARAWMGTSTVPTTALNGTVRLAGRGPVDTTTGRARANDTSLVRTIEGGGDIAITQAASADRPAFDLVASGTLGEQRLVIDSALARMGGVLLEARGALARDSMGVDTLTLSARADSLEVLRGQLDRVAAMMEPVDTAVAASIRALAADTLRGDASLSGYLYGSVHRANATAAVGARALQVGAIRVGRLFGSARATNVFDRPAFEGAANADDVTGVGAVRVQSATFRVTDASPDSGRLVLVVSTDDDATLAARGGYVAQGGGTRVVLDSLQLAYDSVAWRTAEPVFIVRDSAGFRVSRSELRSSVGGVFAVNADVPVNGAVQGQLRFERFPFGEVGALLAGAPPVAGTLSGSVDLTGTRSAPLLAWNIAADSVGLEAFRLPRITSTGRYADRRMEARAELRDTLGGVLRVEGRVPVDLTIGAVEKRLLADGVEGEVVVDSLRLQALPLVLDGVDRLRGLLTGRLLLGGTFERPTARGAVRLAQAGARSRLLNIEPSDGSLVLRADTDSLVLEGLSLRSGGPADTLGARGVLHFADGEPARLDVRLAARDFVVSRQADGTDLDVGGAVRVVGPVKRPVVSGNLFVPRANLVVDPLGARTALDLTSDAARALLGADEVPVAETAAQSLSRLGSYLTVENARVDLGNDVWVQTPEARVKLSGGLNVTMSGEQLALDGEILANRGQYRLELGVVNRSFSVDSGRVRFYGNNAIAPTLDISATNVVRVAGGSEIPVRVHIGGTYDRPVLTLSSSDPLYASAPESEIISLLIFGAPTFALDGQSQSTVRAVTGVLLPSVGGLVEGTLQRWLNVNTLQVSTAGSQQDATLTPGGLLDNLNLTVSAGKQLGERTFLRVNTGICRGVAQATSRNLPWFGLAAEYRIARNWWGQVGVDPGSAPCTRPAGDVFPRLQFGFDLFREWIF